MEYIVIMLVCVVILIAIYLILGKVKKQMKELSQNEELNKITDKMPENIQVCKSILKKIKNEDVELEETQDSSTSLYIAITNKILIGNIKNNFTRIQTIAHECIHSIQNRKMLIFNFIFSNIYILYYLIILILTVFNIIKNPMLQIVIFLILTFTYYFIRSLLEIDAMTRAKYLAEEYIIENNLCSEEELEKLIMQYEKINKIGIPAANFSLFSEGIIKIIIYCIVLILK